MSLKSTVIVEVVKKDNVYQFIMPVGAPLGEAYDAAFEVLNQIVAISKEAVDKVRPQEESIIQADESAAN